MRVLASVCMSFSIAILLCIFLSSCEWFWVLAAIFLLISLVLFLLETKWRRHICLIAGSLLFACIWYNLFMAKIVMPTQKLIGSTQILRVELCEYPQETESGARATVRILQKGMASRAMYYGTKSLLSSKPGDRLAVKVDTKDASGIDNRKVTTYTSDGIWLILFAQQEEIPSVLGNGSILRYFPSYLRGRAQSVIDRAFSERTAAMMHAIILGDQSRLSDEDSLHLKETGLYHITAVSGLHCAFLLAIIGFLTGNYRSKLLASVAIPTLSLYALIVGAPPSVLRACVMLTFTLAAPIFNRESDVITSLSFALFLILLFNPYAIGSIGLQLSFASVGGILFLTPRLNVMIAQRNNSRLLRTVLQSFSVTAGAMIFTVPLSMLYFDSVSLIAPISNFLCLWMASAVFICGFAAVLLGAFYLPIASALGVVLQGGVLYLDTIADWLSKIPYHSISAFNGYFRCWLVFAYACLIFCALARKNRTLRRVSFLYILFTFAASVIFYTLSFRSRPLTVTALDVGQGACTLFLTPDHTFMVDCGSGNKVKKAGNIASDYLLTAGYRSLDAVYLTHFDQDHINGLGNLLSRIRVSALYLPQGDPGDEEFLHILNLAAQYHVQLKTIESTDIHTYDQLLVHVFPAFGKDTSNEKGLSLLCSFGSFDVLITGDMDIETEEILTRYFSADIEALVVGHHGSDHSTSEKLIEETQPEIGIISVGTNSYGHPSEQVLSRLHRAGVSTHRTDEEGTITIMIDRGQKWQIKGMKN